MLLANIQGSPMCGINLLHYLVYSIISAFTSLHPTACFSFIYFSMVGEEEQEGTSEAMAAKPEDIESGGEGVDEDSNEPTTSQPRSSKCKWFLLP
jgi:hypothetical protein